MNGKKAKIMRWYARKAEQDAPDRIYQKSNQRHYWYPLPKGFLLPRLTQLSKVGGPWWDELVEKFTYTAQTRSLRPGCTRHLYQTMKKVVR